MFHLRCERVGLLGMFTKHKNDPHIILTPLAQNVMIKVLNSINCVWVFFFVFF